MKGLGNLSEPPVQAQFEFDQLVSTVAGERSGKGVWNGCAHLKDEVPLLVGWVEVIQHVLFR